MRRILAFLLAAVLAFGLCGCERAKKDTGGTLTPVERDGEKTAQKTGKTYFNHDTWRGDVKFADMEYEHYEKDWFDEYTAPLYELAEKGGSEEDFEEPYYDLENELLYVYLMGQLADIATSRDPSDEAMTEEYLYSQDLYYRLLDEYMKALRTVAQSDHKAVMQSVFGDDHIAYFSRYEDVTEEDLMSYGEEDALSSAYYAEIASADPDEAAIGEVYVGLVKLRQEEAAYYGYDNFADYAYENYYYKDYTPADAQTIWQGVKTYFVPLAQRYSDDMYDGMAAIMDDSRFDTGADAVLAALDDVLPDFSWELYEAYRYMAENGLCDIEHDDLKSATGYTVTLYYVNEPYIFNGAYGEFYDYTDMFHEFGHFANAYYTMPDLLFGYSDNDLCELQAQGMEVMMTHYYDRIFGGHADDALGYVLMNMIYSVIDGAMYDEFQYRVYAEKDLTPQRVNEIFAEVYESYGYEPYDGCETEWMGVGHNFEQPFYYISYSVSALGALELYDLMADDWDTAVDRYLTVLAMDPELYYYSEALEEAGLADIFEADTYSRIAESIERAFR